MKPAKLVLLADTLFTLYRQMLRIRRCEERLIKSFYEGFIPGPYQSALGQEAVYVGVCYHLTREDMAFTSHRGQGPALAKGMPLASLFAELYGRASGCAGGRGGPALISAPEQGIWSAAAMSGTSILQAAGAAYTFKLLKQERIAVSFFGEGAASSGAFYEALNLASVCQLPLLLVCENNRYAGRMESKSVIANPQVSLRAKMYEIPSTQLDGTDVAAVYAAAFEGIRRAKKGEGPTLLECLTTRQRPHSEGDPQEGESSGMATQMAGSQRAAEQDAIERLSARLLETDAVSSDELDSVNKELLQEIEVAHTQAVGSPMPIPAVASIN